MVKTVEKGVPQGSVLGPDLWNLFYDNLLRLEMPEGIQLLAYADDVAIRSTAPVPVLIEESLEEAFVTINDWMEQHGISLAAEKTEAIVFTKRRVHNEVTINCAVHEIVSQASIRYLGVQVDKKLGFAEHADLTSKRAAEAVLQLGHLIPNARGPRQKSRRLLTSVVTSRLLYAAPFWTPTMGIRGWKKMAAVHRRSQMRVACCYRTVSYAVASVVSSIPPIKLLAEERLELHNGTEKDQARANLYEKWQNEWDVSTDGRWTQRIIQDLKRWCTRSFGETTFHITQVITGHGCFVSYLKRFNIQESDECAQCGFAPDNSEHGFFQCDAWENWRRQASAELSIEALTPENQMETMLSSEKAGQ